MHDDRETRVSLEGLDPVEALKALLAVKPDDEKNEAGTSKSESDEHAEGRRSPPAKRG